MNVWQGLSSIKGIILAAAFWIDCLGTSWDISRLDRLQLRSRMKGEKEKAMKGRWNSPVCKKVWQKHVWLSVILASSFVNFIAILGFGVANRNFTQAVRAYFMVYIYMHSALRGLVKVWNIGKVIRVWILLRHLTRWRKVICSKDEL